MTDWNFMSGGFNKRSNKDKLNPCDVKEAVFFHKYNLEELSCFWPKFIDHYHLCLNSSYIYIEPGKSCDYKNNWYRNQSALSEPYLEINQTNWRKCGPSNNNAKCSIGKFSDSSLRWTKKHLTISDQMVSG